MNVTFFINVQFLVINKIYKFSCGMALTLGLTNKIIFHLLFGKIHMQFYIAVSKERGKRGRDRKIGRQQTKIERERERMRGRVKDCLLYTSRCV